MMPEVSIYYLMAIFRVFLLIIGQKQNFSVIASTKNGIDMKCHDSLKPLCEGDTRGQVALVSNYESSVKSVILEQIYYVLVKVYTLLALTLPTPGT